jgi:type II pantothenate kinase
MSHFRLLADPQNYVAHDWDLLRDDAGREYWLNHFANHFGETLKHATTQYGRPATKAIAAARDEFATEIEKLRAEPAAFDGALSIMSLCRLRETILRAHRLNDPFGHVKERENVSACQLYPQVMSELHALEPSERWLRLIQSVFAGNIFDLGCASTIHLAAEPTDFLATMEQIKPRPWLFDDFDRLAQDLPDGPPMPWSKAIMFVDNAGTDLVLGIMPLAREMAMYGTKIVLAANELPALNDSTADETVEVVEHLAAADADLAALIQAGMFEVVSTGNDLPLIDLSEVSDELNEVAADADLIVLEGMGRAVESNFDAAFTVDTLKLALLKDAAVARRVGGELFDCVCRYQPAPASE